MEERLAVAHLGREALHAEHNLLMAQACGEGAEGVMTAGRIQRGVEPRSAPGGELGLQDVLHSQLATIEIGHRTIQMSMALTQHHVPPLAITDGLHPPILLKQRNVKPLCLTYLFPCVFGRHWILMLTRLFLIRPSRVSLSPMGSESPLASTSIRSFSMPRSISAFLISVAR